MCKPSFLTITITMDIPTDEHTYGRTDVAVQNYETSRTLCVAADPWYVSHGNSIIVRTRTIKSVL